MNEITKKSSDSYFSCLNPTNLLSVPSSLLCAILDTVLIEKPSLSDLIEYLDNTGGYPTQEFILDDGTNLEVAKSFLSDVERSGEPDEFYKVI